MKRGLLIIISLLAGLAIWIALQFFRPSLLPPKPRTVEQVLAVLRPSADHHLRSIFQHAGLSYPPLHLTLLVFKKEKRIDLYARDAAGKNHFVVSYPILGASGHIGPKLREGDHQVPEGFYRIELLNPNSLFHLSLRMNYPNAEDIGRAKEERRDLGTLGSDIMIHGGTASIGCLAVGDSAIEELFVLVARTGLDHIEVIIAPYDFRRESMVELPENAPTWINQLYASIQKALSFYPKEEALFR